MSPKVAATELEQFAISLCDPDSPTPVSVIDKLTVLQVFCATYKSPNLSSKYSLDNTGKDKLITYLRVAVSSAMNLSIGKTQYELKTQVLGCVVDLLETPSDRLPATVGSIMHTGLRKAGPTGGEATGRSPKTEAVAWQRNLQARKNYLTELEISTEDMIAASNSSDSDCVLKLGGERLKVFELCEILNPKSEGGPSNTVDLNLMDGESGEESNVEVRIGPGVTFDEDSSAIAAGNAVLIEQLTEAFEQKSIRVFLDSETGEFVSYVEGE